MIESTTNDVGAAAVRQPAKKLGPWKTGGSFRRYLRSGQIRWGLVLLLTSTAIAVIGPHVAPFDPTKSLGLPYAPPDGQFLLGTDQLGRDVLSRVLAGGIHLAWMAPLATILAVGIGAGIGLAAAFYGRWTEGVLMRGMDVVLAFPGLLLAMLFVSMFGTDPWLLVALVALTLIPGVARVMRGAALPLNQREYVLWSRAVGVPGWKILLREILPNVMSPLMVEFGLRLMWSVGILASLSFVGYGIQPPTPDWGLMVSENRTGLTGQPMAVLAPILLIVMFTVSGNLIAEGAARVIARTEGKG